MGCFREQMNKVEGTDEQGTEKQKMKQHFF
jgi:hypothetical protein